MKPEQIARVVGFADTQLLNEKDLMRTRTPHHHPRAAANEGRKASALVGEPPKRSHLRPSRNTTPRHRGNTQDGSCYNPQDVLALAPIKLPRTRPHRALISIREPSCFVAPFVSALLVFDLDSLMCPLTSA